MRPWNPNESLIVDPSLANVRDNLYTLCFPFQNLGDQLDSEIMPLRVQWAADEGKNELDPKSESWRRFKQIYSYQFGEEKVIALHAPELSFQGNGKTTAEQYSVGRYVRIVYLYVKPESRPEFEAFVHKYIVPAAEKILHYRDEVTGAPPPEKRVYWAIPSYMRIVSLNVNMPTIPEFELFLQQHLLPAARDTNTPVLTYRTVTGNRHNYHMFYPFNNEKGLQNSKSELVGSALLTAHQFQQVAANKRGGARLQPAAYKPASSEEDAKRIAADLAAEFHSHALDIEEVVYRLRPDMSATLEGRYSKDSIELAWNKYRNDTVQVATR
ncbi:MAG: hypothetical protein WBX38_14490 [Candidatus Sulfotelmatobacter sp.]